MKRHTRQSRRTGYTLLELLIVALLLSTVLGAALSAAVTQERAFDTGITIAHLEERAETALDRIVNELRVAGHQSISPDPAPGAGSDTVRYMQAIDLVDQEVIWSGLRTLAFEYQSGETNDGLDNNGNRLVDEGSVVLTMELGTANQQRLVITNWVAELAEGELPNGVDDNGNGIADERGFWLERVLEPEGDAYIVRLTLQRRAANGGLMTKTAQSTIRVRN